MLFACLKVSPDIQGGMTMKLKEQGFGGIQVLLVAATIGAASLVAVPKYKAYVNKAKITEAMNLAGESKRKIEQSYMVSGHFPKRASDASAMLTTTLVKPEFVRNMQIDHDPSGKSVDIKVFIHEGVIENLDGEEQFIYYKGQQSLNANFGIEWRCGANGINLDLMPVDCQG